MKSLWLYCSVIFSHLNQLNRYGVDVKCTSQVLGYCSYIRKKVWLLFVSIRNQKLFVMTFAKLFFSGLIQIELNCLWDLWNWVVYWFYAKSGINVKFCVLVKYLWNWVVYWFYAKSGINVKFCVLDKVFVKWVSEMYHWILCLEEFVYIEYISYIYLPWNCCI